VLEVETYKTTSDSEYGSWLLLEKVEEEPEAEQDAEQMEVWE
jgi:hypothetical protein